MVFIARCVITGSLIFQASESQVPKKTRASPQTGIRGWRSLGMPVAYIVYDKRQNLNGKGRTKGGEPRGATMEEKRIRLRGLILPVEWEENGRILGLAVLTDDEQEYRIEKNRMWRALLDLRRQRLEITGVPGVRRDGKPKISIHSYRIERTRRAGKND
jgi:hypothetical protein